MKKVFLFVIAIFALFMIQGFNRSSADAGGGIPLSRLAGNFSATSQGSATLCFKPDFSGTESCSTSGAVPVVVTGPFAGQFIQDKDGNACGMVVQPFSIPGDAHPPTVLMPHFTSKFTNYDPAIGSGDTSFTFYTGGTCNGSKFDNTGATVSSTGTTHQVASDHGERVDLVVTTLTDSVGDIGAFNLTGIDLKQ